MKRTLDHLLGLFRKPSRELEQSVQERVAKRLGLDVGDGASELREMPRFRRWQWPAAAAITAAIVIAVLVPTRIVQSAPAVLEDASGSRKIHFGEIVRPIGNKSATLSMADGSRVETRPQSEFSLERAEDGGTRIRLNRGSVAVVAAASEVRVQQGSTEMKLRPGQSVEHVAMLQQEAVVPAPPKERLGFEVASIRSSGPPAPLAPGARGAGGGIANTRPTKEGCSFGSMGFTVQLDPRRLNVTRVTAFHLIAWAYPVQSVPAKSAVAACDLAGGIGLISGVPDWTKTDMWDIQAGIPEGILTRGSAGGSDRATRPESVDPNLIRMLQTLLAERFKLTVHRETREMPVYLLTPAPGGVKFNGRRPPDPGRRLMINDANGNVVQATPDQQAEWIAGMQGIYRVGGSFDGSKLTMGELAEEISRTHNRPVIDRTGVTGVFDFHLDMQLPAPEGTPRANRVSIGLDKALETIGLKLEESKANIDVWVIDHVEKPSEN